METNMNVEMRVELVQEEVQLAGPTTQTKQGIRQVTGFND